METVSAYVGRAGNPPPSDHTFHLRVTCKLEIHVGDLYCVVYAAGSWGHSFETNYQVASVTSAAKRTILLGAVIVLSASAPTIFGRATASCAGVVYKTIAAPKSVQTEPIARCDRRRRNLARLIA
jgi:hypothetical protein